MSTAKASEKVAIVGTSLRSQSELRIGFLVSSISRKAGGLQSSVRRLAQECHSLGCDVAVYSPADQFSDTDVEAWAPLRPKVFPSIGPSLLRIAPAIDAALRHDDLSILQLHGLWQYPSVQALRWRSRYKRPLLVSPHGMLDSWALQNSSWKKRLARALFEDANLQGAACIRALCESEANSIRALGLRNPIAVIPNGIDLPPTAVLRRAVVARGAGERKSLLFLGRIHPKKGLLETVEAWRLLKDTSPALVAEWRLTIAGWGDASFETALKARVRELGLQGDVEFFGPAFGPVKEQLLAHASAFILASYSEGLPMAVLEAWSYAVPVLMTSACNMPEGFEENAAREISTDPEQLALALGVHLRTGQLIGVGEAGRRLVEQKFGWLQISQQLAAVHDWLLGAGQRPDCVS